MEFLSLSRKRSSPRKVTGGEERGETAVIMTNVGRKETSSCNTKTYRLVIALLSLTLKICNKNDQNTDNWLSREPAHFKVIYRFSSKVEIGTS